jgi:hypothetical protein
MTKPTKPTSSTIAQAKQRAASVVVQPEPESTAQSPSTTTKENSVESTNSAESAAKASSTAPADAPTYKSWTIRQLSDIAEIPVWYTDKVFYFLSAVIRKCHHQKMRLIEFAFHEPGRIAVVMQDIATGEMVYQPPRPDEDPLA